MGFSPCFIHSFIHSINLPVRNLFRDTTLSPDEIHVVQRDALLLRDSSVGKADVALDLDGGRNVFHLIPAGVDGVRSMNESSDTVVKTVARALEEQRATPTRVRSVGI